MRLNDNDLSYLTDIVNCSLDIIEFTKSIEFHQFEKDKMWKLAVERQLEVIGQAANKVSKENLWFHSPARSTPANIHRQITAHAGHKKTALAGGFKVKSTS